MPALTRRRDPAIRATGPRGPQPLAASLRARSAESWGMSDPIPGNDPNAAYDVVPSQDWLHGWTVTCNGIPVRHFVNKANAER
jgi:hypothetical protein